MAEPEILESIRAHIVDAVFTEDLGEEERPAYRNSVVMILEEVGTERRFYSVLDQDAIRQIIKRKDISLTSKDMVEFAAQLRSRTDPVTVEIHTNTQEITPDLILGETPPNSQGKNPNWLERHGFNPQQMKDKNKNE